MGARFSRSFMKTEEAVENRLSEKRAGWLFHSVSGLMMDVRFAGRMLLKNKGFAGTALLTLALCIGANTAIFSILYALVIKPLPLSEPARIVEVYNSFPKIGLDKLPSNVVQYLDFKQHADAFAQVGLWQPGEFTLGENGQPTRAQGVSATAEIFEVLEVKPVLGRFFSAENQVRGADRVLVLTHSFWTTQFQADRNVIGRTLRLDGEIYEIIGVTPRDFEAFDARVKFVRPMSWRPDQLTQAARYGVSPRLYGRLKPDATLASAFAQVTNLEKQFYDTAPAPTRDFLDRSGHVIGADTVQSQRVEPLKDSLYLLQGGVFFVLLIGCVNIANLLLARSNARQGELAIRAALGAGRWIIARQLLVESALLAWIGALVGLGFAWLALDACNRFILQLMPGALPFALDGKVLGYTALVAAAMSLAIGVFPVMHVLSGNLFTAIKSGSQSASTGRGVRAMSGTLVVVQVAFALMLLTGAGLLIHSFANAVAIDPGLDPRQVIAARVALPTSYRKDNGTVKFQQRLLLALQEIPGVTACLATATPFETGLPINALTIRDYTLPPGAAQPGVFHLGASPAYLATLGIPLKEGRWFNESDTDKSRRVFVVDENFARKLFPGRSAVGQHITFGTPPTKDEDWPEVIGVVGNVRHNGVEEKSGNPYLYHPLMQTPFAEVSVLLRSARSTQEIIFLLRGKIEAIDPSLPVFQINSMPEVISTRLNNRRAIMALLVGFAGIALVLSAIGIYGVLAYDVSQRTREIGIRGAIGASRTQIMRLILWQGLWKAGIGLVVGIVGALGLSRFMSTMLYGVKATDPMAYIVVTLILFGVAILASYLPARRAARIDPLIALRGD